MLCQGESPQGFVVHYESDKLGCTSEVSLVLLAPGEERGLWQIESEVGLGDDCEYTVHLTSFNGAGETNSSATLSISQYIASQSTTAV